MPQTQAEKTVINGNDYEMYPLAPSQSMDLLTDLVSVISPVVAPVLTSVFKGKSTEEDKEVLDREVTPDMFSAGLGRLNSSELKNVRRQLVSAFEKVTTRKNVKLEGSVEIVYMGNIGEMLEWIAWGCKVQWGKSLSGLMKGRLSAAASLMGTESQSQSG